MALKKIHKTLELASPTKLQTCASLSIGKILTLKDMLEFLGRVVSNGNTKVHRRELAKTRLTTQQLALKKVPKTSKVP
jgi:hypothetical protein